MAITDKPNLSVLDQLLSQYYANLQASSNYLVQLFEKWNSVKKAVTKQPQASRPRYSTISTTNYHIGSHETAQILLDKIP